jgi:hypothetical protein
VYCFSRFRLFRVQGLFGYSPSEGASSLWAKARLLLATNGIVLSQSHRRLSVLFSQWPNGHKTNPFAVDARRLFIGGIAMASGWRCAEQTRDSNRFILLLRLQPCPLCANPFPLHFLVLTLWAQICEGFARWARLNCFGRTGLLACCRKFHAIPLCPRSFSRNAG